MSYVPHAFEINTLGAAEASKFITVDSNIDVASGLRNLTASGYLQGTVSIRTALIEYTDGDDAITIADGGGVTMAAGITSTAVSNTLGATSFNDASITNVGDIALDSISADGTDINLALTDNSATAFTIQQGSDAYLIVDTANDSESVSIGTGISGTAITIGHATSETTISDNLTVTGDFTVNGTTTTVNSTIVTIDDITFNIAADAADSSECDGAGITIGDGTAGADASILYDHTGTQWELNKATEVQGTLNVVGTITGDTSLTLDAVTITTAEIGVLDSVTAGAAAASKAVVLDASKNIATIGTIGCGAITSTGTSVFGDITVGGGYGSTGTTVSDAGVIQTNGAITSGGVVTATGFTIGSAAIIEAELEMLDGVTAGTAAASKVMTWDGSSNWTAAGGTCANLGTVSAATSITSTAFVGPIDGIVGGNTPAAGTFTTLDCTDNAFAIVNLDINGGTDIGAAIVDADLFIIDDGAGDAIRKCTASRLKTYITGLTVDTEHTSDGLVLGSDVNLYSQAATRTLDLPTAAVAGDVFYIKNNAAAHVLTVVGEGAELIDGSASKILYHQYESLTVICDGTNWHIV